MNGYALLILAALVTGYLLDRLSHRLNLQSLERGIPPELTGILAPETFARTRDYLRAKSRVEELSASLSLAALLLFWFLGGFNRLQHLLAALGMGDLPTGLLYIGSLLLLSQLVELPFSLYATFGVEARFGFNRTTPRTFVLDLLKGVALTLLLGGPLLAVVLLFFQYAGADAWLWCWGAVALFTLGVQYVAPVWLLPLFFKLTPLPPGDVREAVLAYVRSVAFPVGEILEVDGSRRSTKANAFFTGFGANKRIALFDTLIKNHTVPELVGVVAHEVGHYKHRHILQRTLLGFVHTGVLFYLLSLFLTRPELHQAFFMETITLHGGLVFFGLLFTPLELALGPLFHGLSRRFEYQADRYAAQTAGGPEPLAAALGKLAVDTLSHPDPHPLHVALHASHPPVAARIRALRRLAHV